MGGRHPGAAQLLFLELHQKPRCHGLPWSSYRTGFHRNGPLTHTATKLCHCRRTVGVVRHSAVVAPLLRAIVFCWPRASQLKRVFCCQSCACASLYKLGGRSCSVGQALLDGSHCFWFLFEGPSPCGPFLWVAKGRGGSSSVGPCLKCQDFATLQHL